jgi:hypothetical protein
VKLCQLVCVGMSIDPNFPRDSCGSPTMGPRGRGNSAVLSFRQRCIIKVGGVHPVAFVPSPQLICQQISCVDGTVNHPLEVHQFTARVAKFQDIANFNSMHEVHLLLLFRKQCRYLYLDSG